MASLESSAARLIGGVVLFFGLAALGALLWICTRVIASERAWDIGDLAILSVFAAFGAFCLWAGWRLLRGASESVAAIAASVPAEPSSRPARRVTVSHGFAAAGVGLLILCVIIPAQWHPVLFLFGGLACLVVSHVLTPCEERLEKLKKARASMRQL